MCSSVTRARDEVDGACRKPGRSSVQGCEVADPEAGLELLHRRDRPARVAQAALGGEPPEAFDACVDEIGSHVRPEVDEDLPLDAERPERQRHGEIPARAELVEDRFAEGAIGPVLCVRLDVAGGPLEPSAEPGLRPGQRVRHVPLQQVVGALCLRERAETLLQERLGEPPHRRQIRDR